MFYSTFCEKFQNFLFCKRVPSNDCFCKGRKLRKVEQIFTDLFWAIVSNYLRILGILILKKNFSYTHFRNFFTNSLNESSQAYILVIFMDDITSLVTATLSSVLFTVLTLKRKHLLIKFCRHKVVDWNSFPGKPSSNLSQLLEGNASNGVFFFNQVAMKIFC